VISERLSAWLVYTSQRARELGLDIGRSRTRQYTDGVRFERFEWQLPTTDREAIVDSRQLIDEALQAMARELGIALPPPVVEPGVACFTDARMTKFRALLRTCPATAEHPCNVAAAQLPPGFLIRYREAELGEIMAHFPDTIDGVPIYLKPVTEMQTVANMRHQPTNTVTLELPL
jgi:hypothetical protein